MAHENISGSVKDAGGKVEETVGRITGNTKMQADGILNQVEGKIERGVGAVSDTVSHTKETVKTETASLVESGRSTIQTHPYGAVIATFVLGLFFGGMHGGGGR